MKRRRRILKEGGAAVCLVALLAGCAVPRKEHVATYISPTWEEGVPARIVVVPFDAPGCSRGARDLVTSALAMELQAALHADVITASSQDERLTAESALWRRGRVNIDALVAARKEYLADAFVFGTVTHYKEYDPPILGLKVSMISARAGQVLWAAEGLFDAQARSTRSQAEDYFRNSGLRRSLYGPDLMFMSPRLFARFVASEVVRPLRRRTGAPAGQGHPAATAEPLSGRRVTGPLGDALKRLLRLKG